MFYIFDKHQLIVEGAAAVGIVALLNQKINVKGKKPISTDFSITSKDREWASKNDIANIDDHLEPFIETCKANGYKKADWHCFFKKAVRGDWADIGHGNKRRFVSA